MSVIARAFAGAIALAAITGVSSSAARGQTQQEFNWCIAENDPTADQRISGCTAVIQARKLKGKGLAFAFINRGVAYYQKRQYDQAIDNYDQAIKLNPKYAIAFNNRCAVYNDKGEYDHAIQECNQAIKLNPKYADAFFNRGFSFQDKSQYDRAIQNYDQAIKFDPKFAEAFFNRGNIYQNKDQFDRAIQDYDHVIMLNQNHAGAFYNRSLAKKQKGDNAGAEVDLAAARKINPNIGR